MIVTSDHLSLANRHVLESPSVETGLSKLYDGADEIAFVFTKSDVNGLSRDLSFDRSSVPLKPEIARRHSSKTCRKVHENKN